MPTEKRHQMIIALIFVTSLTLTVFSSGQNAYAEQIRIHNPYQQVDWDSAEYYDANLHTHTRLSDGRFRPHEVIDKYHELGYSILALTDHDHYHYMVRPKALYPWTEINDIWNEIKDGRDGRWRESGPWENRDPEQMEMVSIEGSEISRTHHIGSYFNDYASGTRSEQDALEAIDEAGGLSVFYHPGRYDRSVSWYVEFYEEFDSLIGMEVYNKNDGYPQDRQKWDRVLNAMMPERPVWGFANDDMHNESQLGWNRNIFVLEELTEDNVRNAMEAGAFYFYRPKRRTTPPELSITNVQTTDDSIQLTLAGNFREIKWRTYNPETQQSETIHSGTTISFTQIPSDAVFVRAEIFGETGKLYTQPFGVSRD